MPGSSPKGKLAILDLREELPHVKKVLDIGPGWGTYSKLLRKRGEHWDAVEVFKPYIERFKLHKYYDTVYNVNIKDFKAATKYDLVILGDILEHIDMQESLDVLKKIFTFTDYCLLSLPLDDETGVELENSHDYWHNVHEIHLSAWSNTQFIDIVQKLGGEIIALKKYEELGVYLIACNQHNNYLTEKITIFDKSKHGVLTLDAGEAFKQKAKYYILKYTPGFIKKYRGKKA